MKNTPKTLTFIFLFVISLPLAGCDVILDKAFEFALDKVLEADGIEMDESGDIIQMDTEDGKVTIDNSSNVSIPSDFPKDIHIPEDFALSGVMTSDDQYILSGELNKSLPIEPIKTIMQNRGWQVIIASSHEDNTILSLIKNDCQAQYLSNVDDGLEFGHHITILGCRPTANKHPSKSSQFPNP